MGLAFKAKQPDRWYPGTSRHWGLRFCDLLLGASQFMTTRLEADSENKTPGMHWGGSIPSHGTFSAAWVNASVNRRMEGEWATQTVDEWLWYKPD